MSTMFSSEEITKLVNNYKVPDHWIPDVSQPTYKLFARVLTAIDDCNLQQKEVIPQVLQKLAPRYQLTNVGNFVRKIKKQKPDKLSDIFPLVTQSSIIGPHCTAAGITPTWLLNENAGHLTSGICVTNAIICELNEYRVRNRHTWKQVQSWIARLFGLPQEAQRALGTIQTQFALVAKNRDKVRKNKAKLNQFLQEEYKLPKTLEDIQQQAAVKQVVSSLVDQVVVMVDGDDVKTVQLNMDTDQPDDDSEEDQYKELEEMTVKFINALEDLENLRAQTSELHEKWRKEKKEKDIMKKELASVTKKLEQKLEVVDQLRDKIGRFTPRNVNKREERLKEKNEKLRSEKQCLEQELEVMQARLNSVTKAKWNKTKLAKYYKEERDKSKSQGKKKCKNCDDVQQKYNDILQYTSQLEEQLELANSEGPIKTYEKGHYNDKVVKLYINLLTKYNVGVRNVSAVVKEVLSDFGGFEIERLPKYTWITQVLIRARTLSQIQVLEELLANKDNTLQLDGTSKRGAHFGTYDVSTDSGTYVIGLRDMTGGSARDYFNTFTDIISEIGAVASSEDKDINVSKIISSLKNMMTDRHVVNKNFCSLLEEERLKHLPKTEEDWEKLNASEKEKLLEVNDFYCGLHYLVGLADSAESALKVWESIVATKPLGAMAKGFRSSKGESGIQRLIRTSVKAFEEHGCEASGVMGPFENFLRGKGLTCELKPFRGNRFNILFEDGGAVYYHHDHMTEYILGNCPTPNRLIKAVMADLSENLYIAGARALGIINHRLTTPLWSVLESDIHIFDMNDKYKLIVDKLTKWSSDASELLVPPSPECPDDLAKVLVPPTDNPVNQSLYTTEINEINVLTLEALQLMCASMARVSERMLEDHLSGGKWDDAAEDVRQQAKSVPKHNVASEHDFGQLDRLKREKPNATTLAYEALIMYVNNHTSTWFNGLPVGQQQEYLEKARKMAPAIKEAFNKKREKHEQVLTALRMEKERAKREKEVKKQKEKEILTQQLTEVGGLWTLDNMEAKLGKIQQSKQRQALCTQLKFRHVVMIQSAPDNNLWYISKAGKQKSVDELLQNLKLIIDHNNSHQVTDPEPSEVSYRQQEDRRRLLTASVEKIRREVQDDRLKRLARKRQKESQNRLSSPSKRTCRRQSLPPIPDFINRRIEHLYEDEVTGAEDWYGGIVIRRVSDGRIKDPLKVIYEVNYDDGDQAELNIAEDYLNGELNLLDE